MSLNAPARWVDLEDRALWHLELLGCYHPSEAVAPWKPPVFAGYDGDDEGEYMGELVSCWNCGGDGNIIDCCDDLCHGQDWCMHGDNRPCRVCHGEGVL